MSKIFQIKKKVSETKEKSKVWIKFVLSLLVGELGGIMFFLITGRPTPTA